MRHLYEVAAGSVPGRDHAAAGRNNQDAFAWTIGDAAAVAVVCDGCGAKPSSEIGARIGARLAVRTVARRLAHADPRSPRFWDEARDDMLAGLSRAAEFVDPEEGLLFTVVGLAIAPSGGALFALGDGYAVWNGEEIRLGPCPGNEPPYLAYGLFGRTVRFEVLRTGPVDRVLLGTDGVGDLADRLGGTGEFWEDRYFRNPDAVRRRLALLNREVVRLETGGLVRRPGVLPDDTTLVAVRRRGA